MYSRVLITAVLRPCRWMAGTLSPEGNYISNLWRKQSPLRGRDSLGLSKQHVWLYLWTSDILAGIFKNLRAAGRHPQNEENPPNEAFHQVHFLPSGWRQQSGGTLTSSGLQTQHVKADAEEGGDNEQWKLHNVQKAPNLADLLSREYTST